MKAQRPGGVSVPCPLDIRAYVKLEKQARKQGMPVRRYIIDYLASFFEPRVDSTVPKVGRARRTM